MALQVVNAPGQPGYVLLVFGRDIEADPLRLAVCNRISRTYLGHSVGKANWSPARSHYFEAELVSRSDGETVFKIGPEVTAFIPDETTLELTSDDDAISEITVWRNVLREFDWTTPDVRPLDAPVRHQTKSSGELAADTRRKEAEADRQRQAEAARANAEAARANQERPRLEATVVPPPDPNVEEFARWEIIKASENDQDFRDHLVRFPKGVTEPMARTRLESLAWSGLAPTVDSPGLLGFLKAFPGGAHAREARSKLELLERQAAAIHEANERERRAAEAREAAKAAESLAVLEHRPESAQTDEMPARTDETPRRQRLSRKGIFVAAGTSVFAAIVVVVATGILVTHVEALYF